MSFLKTLGLGAYYRVRRMKKALKNWRKFGVIIFGGFLVAASAGVMTPLNVADASGLEYLYVNPAAISVEAGKTYQFGHRAYDANWQPMTVSPVWSIVNSQAGTVNGSGLFTAGNTKGTYEGAVKLSAGALSAYARVVVVEGTTPDPDPSQLTYLYVNPAAISVGTGQSYDFDYTAYNQDWQPMTVPVTWSVTNLTMGTIDQNGNITAGQTKGTYNNAVKVSSGALSAYARVVVVGTTPPPPENIPPVARITPYPATGTAPLSVTLDASASYDSDGTIVKYEWDLDGNGSYELVAGSTVPYTYTTVGTYSPRVRVTDNDSATDYEITNISVTQTPPVNIPPVASIIPSPASGNSPLTTTLNASASYDVDGWITSYDWDWDGDGYYDYFAGPSSIVSHTYGVGTHSPRVRVTDNDGDIDVASTTVVVTQLPVVNQPPVASIIPSPASGYAPLSTTLNASASFDVDGWIVSYDWDWDGNGIYDYYSGNSSIVSHTYSVGTYSPRVRVTDNDGATDIASTTVIAQDIWVQQEYLIGVDGWASDNSLYNYESTSLSSYAWSNMRNPLPGASYYWEKLNGVGYLSGNLYSQNGARFNANNVDGSVTLRVTATWGGSSVSDTVTVYVNRHIVPPPPPVPDTPIYTNFVGVVVGGGTACDDDVIQYTIKLANFEQNLVSGVRLKMDIPVYTSFLSASSTTDHPRIENGVIVWDAGTIYTNETKTLVVRVELNDNFPTTYIQGNAYVAYDQLGGNFNIKSNKLYTCGTVTPIEPLTPTGVDWQVMALLAMVSLGLTSLTYGLIRKRESQMVSF